MSIQLLQDLDFRQHRARSLALETRADYPSTPVTGQLFMHTGADRPQVRLAAGWGTVAFLSDVSSFVSAVSVSAPLTSTGGLTPALSLTLAAAGGLQVSSSALALKLPSSSGLTLTSTGLAVVTDETSLEVTADYVRIKAGGVTFAKLQTISTDRLLGRDTAAAGAPEELEVGGGLEFTGSGGIRRSALTGDVTATAGSASLTIAAAAVTNAKLADMATATIKGRTTAGTGAPEDLTATQATALLNAMVGDSGSGGTKGLVPAPTTGDAVKFLRGDGTWTTVPGGTLDSLSDVTITSPATGATLVYNGAAWVDGQLDLSDTDSHTGTLSITHGGTGATTAAAAFLALAPAAPDDGALLWFDDTAWAALPPGAHYNVLFCASGGHPSWGQVNLSSADAVISVLGIGNGGTGQATAATGFDALAPTTTRGDLIVRDASTNARLALGAAGRYLRAGATDPAWSVLTLADAASQGTTTTVLHGNAGGAVSFGPIVDGDITAATITYAKIQNVSATDRLLGRDTAAAGVIEELTVGGGIEFTGSGGIQRSALSGDISASAGSGTTAIGANKVTLAMLAQVATATFLGRTTASTGDVESLTVTQATALLNAFVGDSGSGGTKGLVPAPAAGDAAALKFLKADGTWAAVAAGASALDDLTDVTITSPATGATLIYNGSVWVDGQLDLADTDAVTGTLPLARGGTSATSALGAFDALSPVTTRGDLVYRNAVNNARLAIGAANTFLRSNSIDPSWAAFDAVSDMRNQGTTIQVLHGNAGGAVSWGSVVAADIALSATDRLLGRDTAAAGAAEELTVGGGLEFTGSGGIQRSALSGDISATAGSGTTVIGANKVTNAMLRQSAALALIGRSANSTGDVADITTTSGSFGVLRESGGSIGFGSITGSHVSSGSLDLDKLVDLTALTVIGNAAATPGAAAEITATVADSVLTYDSATSVLGFHTIRTDGIRDAAVTLAKIEPFSTDRLVGRDTAGTGVLEALTVGGGIEFTGSGGIQRSALSGDISASAGSGTTAIGANKVTLAMMAQVATARFLGRTTASTGDVESLTVTQATALLNAFVGDSGSGGTKGLVPAPASGDAAALKFLKADGTWAVPAGGAAALDDLTDVVITGVLTGQPLLHDSGEWANGPLDLDNSNSHTGTLGLSRGGTGQTSALAAFNALSPVTTRGDLIVRGASDNVRLAVGANKFYLRSDGTDPAWSGLLVADITNQGTVNQLLHGHAAGAASFSALVAADVTANTLTFATMQQIATDRLLGRDTAATGDIEALTVGGGIEFTGSGGIQTSAFTGDVTKSAGGTATTIGTNVVTLGMMAQVATARFLGRTTASTGDVESLTVTQATALLNAVVGDSGAGGTKGLVPAPGAGDAAALKFLKADGTWAAVTVSMGLDDLTDVTITSPATGATLVYNGAAWVDGQLDLADSDAVTGTLPITRGGTGNTAATTAFDALAPTTTRGDIICRSATNNVRRAIGAANTFLRSDGIDPTWVAWSAAADARNQGTTTQVLHGNAGGGASWGAVVVADVSVTATDRLLGRDTAAAGAAEELTVGGGLEFTGSGGIQRSALSGDISASAGSGTTAIGANKVTLAMMAQVATATFLGRTTASTGDVESLTTTQATALLNVMVGDSGSGGTKGLVPAPTTGDATKFLRGDATWATVPALSDGDKGDITVSASGATWTIDNSAVSYAKIQNVSATDRLLGRSTAGAGVTEEIVCTPFARTILDDAAGSDVRTTIGAGDVVGPGSATANGLVLFDGTTGKLVKDAAGPTYASGMLTVPYVKVSSTEGLQLIDELGGFYLHLEVKELDADHMLSFDVVDGDRTLTIGAHTTLSGGTHSGTNTGDQTITLTGDVTGTGTGSFATAIGANKVVDAMIRQSAGLSLIGRSANSTGNVADITAANDGEVLRRSGTAIGFGTIATAGLTDAAVTLAKIANIATDRLVGRDTASSGVPEELTVGGGLEFTGSGGIQRSALSGDISASAGSGTTAIGANKVLDTMLRQSAGLSVPGRSANSTGDVADITAGSDGHVLRRSGTTLGFGTVETGGITDNAVTLAKMATMATASFLGRNTASTGNVEVLSATTATAILNTMVGDSGSGGTKGLVPAPASGDAASGYALGAGATWLLPDTGVTLCFQAATATGTNTRTIGSIQTTSLAAAPIVTSGKTAYFMSVVACIESGATNGDYTVDIIARNEDDSTDVILHTLTCTVAGGTVQVMRVNKTVTALGSAYGTLAAGKRYRIGWLNRSSSPGSLSAVNKTVYFRVIER